MKNIFSITCTNSSNKFFDSCQQGHRNIVDEYLVHYSANCTHLKFHMLPP